VKVLVFGTGGSIGRQIVHETLTRRHDVTAVHRQPAANQDGHRVITGDVHDPLPALAAHDQDAVVSAVGHLGRGHRRHAGRDGLRAQAPPRQARQAHGHAAAGVCFEDHRG
jgi:putative NADH-flavin reductase